MRYQPFVPHNDIPGIAVNPTELYPDTHAVEDGDIFDDKRQKIEENEGAYEPENVDQLRPCCLKQAKTPTNGPWLPTWRQQTAYQIHRNPLPFTRNSNFNKIPGVFDSSN